MERKSCLPKVFKTPVCFMNNWSEKLIKLISILVTTSIILLGNHIVGIVSGKEDYDILKVSCKESFGEINKLVAEGEIDVDNKKIPLEFYLSGDYKVKQFVYI